MATTVSQMGKLKPFSKEWFNAAFEGCKAPEFAIEASKKICIAYGIHGQSDPAYIANVIAEKYQDKYNK